MIAMLEIVLTLCRHAASCTIYVNLVEKNFNKGLMDFVGAAIPDGKQDNESGISSVTKWHTKVLQMSIFASTLKF